jgi:hypothetical protein
MPMTARTNLRFVVSALGEVTEYQYYSGGTLGGNLNKVVITDGYPRTV